MLYPLKNMPWYTTRNEFGSKREEPIRGAEQGPARRQKNLRTLDFRARSDFSRPRSTENVSGPNIEHSAARKRGWEVEKSDRLTSRACMKDCPVLCADPIGDPYLVPVYQIFNNMPYLMRGFGSSVGSSVTVGMSTGLPGHLGQFRLPPSC